MTAIFFPHMHPALAGGECPEWVHFLSPGLPEESMRHPRFLPADLPMSEQESVRYARKVSEFANQFRNPKELSALSAQAGQTPFYQDTVQALRDDLSAHLKQGTEGKSSDLEKPRLQGQMNLIMSWMIEEQAIALLGLKDTLDSFQRSMDNVLGIEDRPEGDVCGDFSVPDHNQQLVHWSKLLPWFLLFLGPQDALVIQDPSLIAQWAENGADFESYWPNDHTEHFAHFKRTETELLTAECTGADLIGSREPTHHLPWMMKQIRIYYLPAG